MKHEFERIVIVNRGEAAMRFIRAVREFNQQFGASLHTIALYTEPDRRGMFVREADEAFSLGLPHHLDRASQQMKSSYVDYGKLRQALTAARAEAAWVGWGFVAEHAEFADLCRDMDIVFIGPSGDVMRRLGDKISSKLLAEAAQIPIALWSGGPVESIEDAVRHGERLGYPLLIKATAGGGGHGIRRVFSADQLPREFERARAEAFKAFGDATVFMEQLITGARHVEVQVIADNYGAVWAAGVRDCTIQRRHQKVLEEAPSPALIAEQDRELRDAAVRLSRAAGYHNAGTVEFLYEPNTHCFLFMEMNTRLQVEHPVTECTTGLDLVKLQIHVARGGRLEGEPPRSVGHAIEVRLNAEDPDSGFTPSPGKIERFRISMGPGMRLDTGVAEGDVVPSEFDSMIAKIIAYGHTRGEALARLLRSLRESSVVVKGGTSNKAFLMALLARPEVQKGEFDVGWLDRVSATGELLKKRYSDVALLQAAIESYIAEFQVEQSQFYASAVRGRPNLRAEVGRSVALRLAGQSYSLKVSRIGLQHYRVESDSVQTEVHLERLGAFESWLTAGDHRYNVVSVAQGFTYRIEVDGVSHTVERDDGGVIHAPAPAVVVSIAVQPGDVVAAGDRLVVLEAMKMETQLVAPFAGRVRQVLAIPNVQVDVGAALLQLEPVATETETPSGERVVIGESFATASSAPSETSVWQKNLVELHRFVLGFDVDPAHINKLFSKWSQLSVPEVDTSKLRQLEDEVLRTFMDIGSLFRRRPRNDDPTAGEVPSSEVHLFSYLRSLDTGGEGLPAIFMNALRRALCHYGIRELERSQALEEGLLWIYKSHLQEQKQAAAILRILERRLAEVVVPADNGKEEFRDLLDRLIANTRGQYHAVSDMARELRYRDCDKPQFEKVRSQVYSEVVEHLDYLALQPDAADRNFHKQALVDCPQPVATLFAARFADASPMLRRLMLEVLLTRYYRPQVLQKFRSVAIGDRCCVAGEFSDDQRRVHAFATHSDYQHLSDALKETLSGLAGVTSDCDLVLDFYTWNPVRLSPPDITSQEILDLIAAVNPPPTIQRIVVTVSAPGQDPGMAGMQHFTFLPNGDGVAEDKLFRGVHPMMARRLHLWRLENFNIERLPSVEDVYLLRAIAKENPKDERLFAVAEVRDLTPVRDASGRVVQLPHLERMLAEAAAAIRRFQSRRPPNQRLYWNRIFLYLWQPITLKPDEINEICRRLAPSTDGLGLEQVVVRAQMPNPQTGELRDTLVRISAPGDAGLLITFRPAGKLRPLKPLSDYEQKVVKMRQRGMIYPYEIIKMITPEKTDTRAEFPPGDFKEYELDTNFRLVPVDRPYGQNPSNIIVGVIRNFTAKYPEGMTRVILLGDPSKDLGALAEPECHRIIAALDLAEHMHVPLEWFPISAGAKISMNSGVENMDWIARVLRRIIEFTQGGGEINLLVNGINVGAQPYWNAEATMLLHTCGILVMTPSAAMVLTGKRALDYSGSVSAEDNQGIGGYDRIMGFNGQAQYFARDVDEACQILFRHYEHTYIVPGERFPRRALTTDTPNRDVCLYSIANGKPSGFKQVGDIFSDETNPGRKSAFEIRKVMMAVIDQDRPPMERWSGMNSAETAVIWDAHLGGMPVCLIGIESQPVPRLGFVPADGPDAWTAGTLFPLSSKKVARAINAASNNRPVVVLANLSGFDGSPESMRCLQLEYGAEIGRAVVNFQGPMVFCVISRYHGGAYVVFSRVLNEHLEVVALEGTHASVIGGAPAAAVVFAGEVDKRARADARLEPLNQALAKAEGVQKNCLRTEWEELFKVIHSEKLGEVAAEFDRIHSVNRALQVGALHQILPPGKLRPYLIHAVDQGIIKNLEQHRKSPAQQSATLKPKVGFAVAMDKAAPNGDLLVRTNATRPAGR
jgi:acetyl/propionyl-CoA carboxylase alpha subunit/acetyl-CoA carboxylase carboxyltransferase component